MTFIEASTKQEILERLKELENPVRLVNFTQELECDYCRETRQLLEELSGLSDKISLEVYNFITDKEKAEAFGVDKIPATVVMGQEKDYGIRFYGIPAGYEFSALLETILAVSRGQSSLKEDTRKALQQIQMPVHLQVFVTPTCPYCPRAVFLGNQLALESEHIRADMVEVTEFPHLAQKYRVMGVPKTVANEQDVVEGAVPEEVLVERLRQVLSESHSNEEAKSQT